MIVQLLRGHDHEDTHNQGDKREAGEKGRQPTDNVMKDFEQPQVLRILIRRRVAWGSISHIRTWSYFLASGITVIVTGSLLRKTVTFTGWPIFTASIA